MRYHSLPQLEQKFRDEAAAFLKPFTLPVSGEPSVNLKGMLYSPVQKNYYYTEQFTKERIVLHLTAGNTWSDMKSLTTANRHVSVAFLIARDGTIYQLFSSGGWSGHLGAGVGNTGTNNQQDKATIGIEISNYGYLVPKGANLETIYGTATAPDPYCSLDEKDAYVKIDKPFRGQSYYASFTPQQMNSTAVLLKYLTKKFNIPRAFLPTEKRFLTTEDVLKFKGIVSHVNYRPSGKWDIGPAFDWDKLIKDVNS
jgi:N-acetyl-anhydromuramyl-L-alanine amidase AmpD